MNKEIVTESAFHNAWEQSKIRRNSFSYEGRCALYKYLIESDLRSALEQPLDIVSLDSTYSEFSSFNELQEGYHIKDEEIEGLEYCKNEKEREKAIRDYFMSKTFLIEFEGGIIIEQF